MTISTLQQPSSNDADNAIIQEALTILQSRLKQPDTYITSPSDRNGAEYATRAFLKLKLSEIEHEVFAVLFLHTRNGVIMANLF